MEFKKVYATGSTSLLECFNPVLNKYVVRFDEKEEDGVSTYQQYLTDGKPDLESIKEIVLDYYSKLCDQEIIQGFYFEGNEVWLTMENQFNYKAAWDLAFQTNGANLPSTFKFGTNEKPIYRVFETVSDLQDFYVQSITYIENVLKKYWLIKDGIEWDKYIIE